MKHHQLHGQVHIELESGITIRDVQEEIATQMCMPPSNRNAVMQLNMGEGNLSVIIPIVAAALADGTRLVRVVVPKPQSKQMAHILRSKLSGLLHRRIYFMPFSRALQLDASAVATIAQICRECMEQGGVVLLLPEHILSFELMGLDHRLGGRPAVGQALWDVQTFLDQRARDIVDESDENFNVKFELVYTMGAQRPIEMSSHRWIIIHQVLDLVRAFAPEVVQAWPLGLLRIVKLERSRGSVSSAPKPARTSSAASRHTSVAPVWTGFRSHTNRQRSARICTRKSPVSTSRVSPPNPSSSTVIKDSGPTAPNQYYCSSEVYSQVACSYLPWAKNAGESTTGWRRIACPRRGLRYRTVRKTSRCLDPSSATQMC